MSRTYEPTSKRNGLRVRERQDGDRMISLLWGIVVLLVVLWLVGLVANIAGGLIHILLVIAIVVVAYNCYHEPPPSLTAVVAHSRSH